MTRGAARAAHAVALVLAAGVVAGCGGSPQPLGPSGVDDLTIPTPRPDPADFSSRVDNPFFPLRPGTRWTYRRDTIAATQTLVATVLAAPHPVDGIATTALRWQVLRPHGRATTVAVRWYAQDRAGNVWWFGQRLRPHRLRVDQLATQSWTAGRGGARAGLLVSATPRVGDGYDNAYEQGVVERRSTVLSIDATVAVPHHTYRRVVVTRDLSSLEPTLVVQSFYAPGVGLAAQQAVSSVQTQLSLVRETRP